MWNFCTYIIIIYRQNEPRYTKYSKNQNQNGLIVHGHNTTTHQAKSFSLIFDHMPIIKPILFHRKEQKNESKIRISTSENNAQCSRTYYYKKFLLVLEQIKSNRLGLYRSLKNSKTGLMIG